MPPKGWKKSKTDGDAATAADPARICELLARIPVDQFISMASTSGLTRDEIRELCEAVRKLSE